MPIVPLPRLHLGSPSHRGGLSVFPVWAAGAPVRGLSSGGAVAVDEREGAPVVGELVAHNRGAQPALLLAGELFEGGWQHRALVHDVVLAPGNLAVVAVSCVEQGRWQGTGQHWRRGRRASLLVRSAQTSQDRGQQSQVWERVSRYDRAYGHSSTGTLLHHLTTVLPSVPPSPDVLAGQRGVLIGIGGQPALLELFPDPRSLRRHLPALLASASLDAGMQPSVPTPGRHARAFVAALAASAGRRFQTVSTVDAVDGRAVAGESDHVLARGVLWQDRLAHLTVLNPRHDLMLAA